MSPLLIFAFIILLLLSAFFSWTEIALMTLEDHKIESLIKQKRLWSKSLKKIKKNNDRLLITILIWNNLANIYTASLATSIAISLATSGWLSNAFAIGIATWIVTFTILVFWEIVPKSFATKNSTLIAVSVAPIYEFLIFIFYPLIIFMETIVKIFSWKNKVKKITDEEIESFIDMWVSSGGLNQWEYEKIKNILDFEDTTAEETMVPRVKIKALSSKTTVEEAIEYYLSHTYSRIPVYKKTIDNIENYLTIRDIIKEDKKKKLSELNLPEVLKAPLNKPISKLLNTFQKSNKHIAILIDEYGWVEWLVTLEDILEEIFWEIRDETDNETDEISKIWENIFICESYVLFEDVLEKFNLELENIWLDEKEFWWATLSYIITHKLGRFPTNWEIISFNILNMEEKNTTGKIFLKILDIENSKIWKVEVKLEM